MPHARSCARWLDERVSGSPDSAGPNENTLCILLATHALRQGYTRPRSEQEAAAASSAGPWHAHASCARGRAWWRRKRSIRSASCSAATRERPVSPPPPHRSVGTTQAGGSSAGILGAYGAWALGDGSAGAVPRERCSFDSSSAASRVRSAPPPPSPSETASAARPLPRGHAEGGRDASASWRCLRVGGGARERGEGGGG